MKNLIIFILLMFFVYSCEKRKNKITTENYVELSDDLNGIIASYINYQSCNDCVYEIYFNKIDPHYNQIILYKGNHSLTINEYEKKGKSSVIYTEILDKKIYLYTGGEGYFKTTKNAPIDVKEKESNKSFNVWVISDSLNTRKIDTLDYAYPFLPLPVKRKFPQF